jgi:HEAT repeat protein
MGFKTDTSFLRFLSMGAIGVRQTIKQLRAAGFDPIELERYCGSNKIWMTKVKRLRMPDVLCVRTGLRLEVRAKSDLKIRMSDAPNNPDRTWDAGLRDDDVAAFIAILDGQDGIQHAADEPVFFTVRTLRQSVNESRLGPPKSASEGAERDRTWPAIIPSCDGTVQSVTAEKLIVALKTGENALRRQTYTLNGKNVYVRPGDRFKADVSILAGAPTESANMPAFLRRAYDPLAALREPNAVDRYAAVKALPHRRDLRNRAVAGLEELLAAEGEERVALEAAGSAATLGSALGQERIGQVLWGEGRKDLRMEAVLILTELASPFARAELVRVIGDQHFQGDEIRQAAVWGLGKAGLKAYEQLLPFIADSDENVALHAIVAFGKDTTEPVIRALLQELIAADPRRAPAASEALRLIGNETALRVLMEAAGGNHDWVLATLGRLPPALVRPAVEGSDLMTRLGPMLLLSQGANWLASEDRVMDIGFLTKQNI